MSVREWVCRLFGCRVTRRTNGEDIWDECERCGSEDFVPMGYDEKRASCGCRTLRRGEEVDHDKHCWERDHRERA